MNSGNATEIEGERYELLVHIVYSCKSWESWQNFFEWSNLKTFFLLSSIKNYYHQSFRIVSLSFMINKHSSSKFFFYWIISFIFVLNEINNIFLYVLHVYHIYTLDLPWMWSRSNDMIINRVDFIKQRLLRRYCWIGLWHQQNLIARNYLYLSVADAREGVQLWIEGLCHKRFLIHSSNGIGLNIFATSFNMDANGSITFSSNMENETATSYRL